MTQLDELLDGFAGAGHMVELSRREASDVDSPDTDSLVVVIRDADDRALVVRCSIDGDNDGVTVIVVGFHNGDTVPATVLSFGNAHSISLP